MLVANNAPYFERNDLDIHFFRYSGGDHSGAAIWGGTRPFGDCHLKGTATLKALPLGGMRHLESTATWSTGHSGERDIRGCGPKPDDPPAALPPKSKLTCKLAYDLRLPPYAACLRLP